MSSRLNRRAFIGGVGALSAGAYLSWRLGLIAPGSSSAEGLYLIGNIRKKAQYTGLATISESAQMVKYWRVPLVSHSAFQNPARPWQIASVEKKGGWAAFIDTRFESSTRTLPAPQGLEFYGHGFFSGDGSLIFLSAQEPVTAKGYILIYDSISLHLLEKLDSGGYRPHELQVDRENPDQLLIANSGTPDQQGKITWISMSSGKQVRNVGVSHADAALAHFTQTSQGDIYFAGSDNGYLTEAEYMSFGHFRRDFDKVDIVSANWGKKWKGEALNSFIDHANNRIWLTLPVSDCVLIMDKDKKTLLKEIPNIPKARSIVPFDDNGHKRLAISHHRTDDRGDQIVFDLNTMEVVTQPEVKPYVFYSIHASSYNSSTGKT